MTASGQLHDRLRAVCRGRRHSPARGYGRHRRIGADRRRGMRERLGFRRADGMGSGAAGPRHIRPARIGLTRAIDGWIPSIRSAAGPVDLQGSQQAWGGGVPWVNQASVAQEGVWRGAVPVLPHEHSRRQRIQNDPVLTHRHCCPSHELLGRILRFAQQCVRVAGRDSQPDRVPPVRGPAPAWSAVVGDPQATASFRPT